MGYYDEENGDLRGGYGGMWELLKRVEEEGMMIGVGWNK